MSQRRQAKGVPHRGNAIIQPHFSNFLDRQLHFFKIHLSNFTNKTTTGLPLSTPVWLLTILSSRSTKAISQCSRGTNTSSKSRNLCHLLEVRRISTLFSPRGSCTRNEYLVDGTVRSQLDHKCARTRYHGRLLWKLANLARLVSLTT